MFLLGWNKWLRKNKGMLMTATASSKPFPSMVLWQGIKKFTFTQSLFLPLHHPPHPHPPFCHSPDWEILSFSSKQHFESGCIVVYAKYVHIHAHICKVQEQFLLWIRKLNALVHITFSMELQSTIMYHRIHISRTQNNSGFINSVTYINTKVRHVCDSFMPHGSFFVNYHRDFTKIPDMKLFC